MPTRLEQALQQHPLVADGAMGTELMAAGLESGACGEAWNLEHPDRVLAIQRRYVEAGADCIITNTFGASAIMLRRHGHEREVEAINREGARIAREAFGGGPGFVLGDIGPFGGVMAPYGEIEPDEVARAFAAQARALVAGGVDAVIVETQTSLDELALAIRAAQDAGAACVIGSLAYDALVGGGFRTMMGVSPEQAAEFVAGLGAQGLGLNCGTGVDMWKAGEIVRAYRASCGLFTVVQPNAGQPVLEDFKAVYKMSPEQLVEGVPALIEAGAAVIGACCGSTPSHIRAIRQSVDALAAAAR
jgi:5-methyltetrahydrofolate--homocysteine methyltransferase